MTVSKTAVPIEKHFGRDDFGEEYIGKTLKVYTICDAREFECYIEPIAFAERYVWWRYKERLESQWIVPEKVRYVKEGITFAPLTPIEQAGKLAMTREDEYRIFSVYRSDGGLPIEGYNEAKTIKVLRVHGDRFWCAEWKKGFQREGRWIPEEKSRENYHHYLYVEVSRLEWLIINGPGA